MTYEQVRRVARLLALAVSATAAAPALAENWPAWRGPLRNGVSAERDVPLRWSATEGVRWKASLPGAGISNPIVWDNRVICTSADGRDQQDLHIICMSVDNGRTLWHTRLWGTSPTLHHATKSSMASPSPVTDGEHIFAFFGTGDVLAVDMEGRLAWHRSLAAEYGPFENRFASSSSPLLFEDLLIVQCDHYGPSYVLAIDKQTGGNRWKTDRPEAWLSWSSPICAPVGGSSDEELIVCGSEKIDALDPRTGARLWTLAGMARECVATPIAAGGLVYATSGPGAATFAIRGGGRGDVTNSHAVWRSTRGNPFVPSAILVGRRYYVADDNGIATCLDGATGKTVWRKRFGGKYTASPVAADDKIYFTNEAGETLVIAAAAPGYQELARNSIGEPVFASPAIAAGCVFLRSAGHLWCIDGADDRRAVDRRP